MTQPTEPDSRSDVPARSPNAEWRFVQRSLQAFIQWSPLGGSGCVFITFLLRQDWMFTLLMFPVMAVSAVWAAWSKNFITQLQEVYAERGKRDANAFVSWLDSLNETIKWQFSGFEAKYLKCQRSDCQDDHPDGIRQDQIPLLHDVFVPLRLSTESMLPGYTVRPQTPEEAENCRTMLIWDLLKLVRHQPMYRQMAIRAWGGYGKTTLLKHVAYTYGDRAYRKYRAPKLVPFLLYLTRCWKELVKENPPTLPDLLTHYHLSKLPQGQDLKAPPNWALNLLRQGDALVMFDGFDEVPPAERGAVSEWLSQQMRNYGESVFLITSRPTAYDNDYIAKPPTASFWVEDFNADQRRRFVEQWYLCQERYARGGRNTPDVQQRATQNAAALLAQIDSRPELEAIAGNALLLNMMARFHRDKQGADLPQRKVELYQDICELQLARRSKAKGIPLLLSSLSQRQEVLQHVALAMMQRAAQNEPGEELGFKQIQRDDLLNLLSATLAERDSDVEPQDFLKQIVDISELLVQRDRGVYEFAHLTFQEFLAASEVVRLKQESLLYEWLLVDAWKPTILFYANLVNPTSLLRQAIERHAVNLAYQIWYEAAKRPNLSAATKLELEALKQRLYSLRYQQLEEYLKTQQWRKADDETYRLMITTVGKEEGQWFDRADLETFPCEDLQTLDRLWVKYSNGKWGFSVQKQIWQKCGSPMTYNDDWEKFGDRVGWRKDGHWLNYDQFTFDLEKSLAGEFPSGCGLWGDLLGNRVFIFWVLDVILISLFSRRDL